MPDLTARGMEEMDVEAGAFIDRIFGEWLEGHFGKRLGRVDLGTVEEVDDGTPELRDRGLAEAAEEGEIGEIPAIPGPPPIPASPNPPNRPQV